MAAPPRPRTTYAVVDGPLPRRAPEPPRGCRRPTPRGSGRRGCVGRVTLWPTGCAAGGRLRDGWRLSFCDCWNGRRGTRLPATPGRTFAASRPGGCGRSRSDPTYPSWRVVSGWCGPRLRRTGIGGLVLGADAGPLLRCYPHPRACAAFPRTHGPSTPPRDRERSKVAPMRRRGLHCGCHDPHSPHNPHVSHRVFTRDFRLVYTTGSISEIRLERWWTYGWIHTGFPPSLHTETSCPPRLWRLSPLNVNSKSVEHPHLKVIFRSE